MDASEGGRPRRARLPSNERVRIDGEAEASAWTINWSGDGVCLMCDERKLRPGETVSLELPERHYRGTGRVIWAWEREGGCIAGLEILTLDRRAT